MIHRFRGLHDSVTCLAFSGQQQQQVGAGSLDHSVFIWSLAAGEQSSGGKAFRYSGHSDAVLGLSFSPSGRLLASCSRDKTVRIWVNSARAESTDFKAHSASVRSVEFSPDGQHLLTASDDKSIKFWTLQRHKFTQSIAEHKNWVRCARYSPDGRTVASCSDDKTIRLFDERTTEPICVFQESKGYGNHLAFHPSGTCLGVGTSDKKVKVYDIRMQKLQQLYSSHEGPVTQVSVRLAGWGSGARARPGPSLGALTILRFTYRCLSIPLATIWCLPLKMEV